MAIANFHWIKCSNFSIKSHLLLWLFLFLLHYNKKELEFELIKIRVDELGVHFNQVIAIRRKHWHFMLHEHCTSFDYIFFCFSMIIGCYLSYCCCCYYYSVWSESESSNFLCLANENTDTKYTNYAYKIVSRAVQSFNKKNRSVNIQSYT